MCVVTPSSGPAFERATRGAAGFAAHQRLTRACSASSMGAAWSASQPTASRAQRTVSPVSSMRARRPTRSRGARRNGQWQPSMPGTTGSVTSGQPSRASSTAHQMVAVHEQLEHAAQAALAARRIRPTTSNWSCKRHAPCAGQPRGDRESRLHVVERGEEVGGVGAHHLGREVEVAGQDHAADLRPSSQSSARFSSRSTSHE